VKLVIGYRSLFVPCVNILQSRVSADIVSDLFFTSNMAP